MEGLSQAASCTEDECPWFDGECGFVERLVELMVGPGGGQGRESACG